MSWQFATAGRVVFGRGSTGQLAAFLQRLKIARPLLVTDARLLELKMAEPLLEQLRGGDCHPQLFADCQPEPPYQCAIDGARLAREHACDGIVALGGGSNIDVAKMISVLVAHGGQPRDYFGFDRVPGPVLPLIACPTTAGTGSEVSNSSVLTDREAGVKVSSLSHYLRPAVALVDPDLTDSCPPNVSAHSGIDALVHAIEAVTARRSDEMPTAAILDRAYEGAYGFTQLLGLEAIRLIGRSLVAAVRDGTNRAARDDMALAATLAGMAFSNSGVALVHALEYPIGVLTHCSHGEGNGLLLPHVMRFNLESRVVEFAKIAQALQGTGPSLDQKASADERFALAASSIAMVERLQADVQIRTQLRRLGMSRQQLPEVAAKAFAIKRLMDTNPRTPSESDLLQLLEAAF
ncbi:MAG: iron-containing alcohol dehydrogenase [Aureliella sp.]